MPERSRSFKPMWEVHVAEHLWFLWLPNSLIFHILPWFSVTELYWMHDWFHLGEVIRVSLGENSSWLLRSHLFTWVYACIFLFVAESCLTLCDPVACSLPASSVRGIYQARALEQVAILFSRGSSQPRDWTHVSCIGRWILCHWAIREALYACILCSD